MRGAAWLSSARAVRCRLKCHNERNPHRRLLTVKAEDSGETAGVSCEEGGDDVKSARPLYPGLHTCYNGRYKGQLLGNKMLISKADLSSDWSLQLDSMKLDSLVIAHQPWRGEYVPGPCTHRPSSHGSLGRLKSVTARSGLRQNKWLGLSRNKVAVPEGVAGTPPFWRHGQDWFAFFFPNSLLYIYNKKAPPGLSARRGARARSDQSDQCGRAEPVLPECGKWEGGCHSPIAQLVRALHW